MSSREELLTMPRHLAAFADTVGDREAFVFPDADPPVRWTAREFDRELNRVAHGYRALGLTPGTRVALTGRNTPQFVAAIFATMKLGLVPAVFNSRESADRLAALGDRFEPGALVYDPEVAETAAAVVRSRTPGTRIALGADGTSGDLAPTHAYAAVRRRGTEAGASPAAAPAVDVSRDDTAFVNWSTGTTGLPKGLVWSQEGAVMATVVAGASKGARRDDVRIVFSTPGFMGWLYAVTPTFSVGTTLVFMESFDPDRYLQLVEAEGATWIGGVASVVRMILDAGPEDYDLGSVRAAFYAAEGMDAETIDRLGEAVSEDVFSVYAASEGTGLTTVGSGVDDPTALSDHRPLVEARAVELRPDGGKAPPDARVPVGERGELIIRTPARAERVFGDPERTAHVYRDGWWYTDDVVKRGPKHTFTVVGRTDDMIITGGINVFPRKVEAVLVSHPAVSAAVVVGLADEQWGERIAAAVVPEPDRPVDAGVLDEYCLADDRLPRHARPREYHVLDAGERLPRSPSGKIDTSAVADRLESGSGTRIGGG